MINLLPPETAKQIHASRHNNLLLRYLTGLLIVLGLIVCVYAATFVLMRTTEQASTESSQENKQKIAQHKATEQQAKAYMSNLKTAKSLFDSQLSYTAALSRISSALPAGTILQGLDLSPDTVGEPVSLAVQAKSKSDALAVKTSLEKAEIAHDITIASLTDQADAPQTGDEQSAAAASPYPVQISLNLTFSDTIFSPLEEAQDE